MLGFRKFQMDKVFFNHILKCSATPIRVMGCSDFVTSFYSYCSLVKSYL